MCAAFIFSHGMNFIDDHPLNGIEDGLPFLLREKKAETLGRGQKNVRRTIELLLAFVAGRVTGTQTDVDGRVSSINFAQRFLEIFFEIITERTERRDVNGA